MDLLPLHCRRVSAYCPLRLDDSGPHRTGNLTSQILLLGGCHVRGNADSDLCFPRVEYPESGQLLLLCCVVYPDSHSSAVDQRLCVYGHGANGLELQ